MIEKNKKLISMWCVMALAIITCFYQTPIVCAQGNKVTKNSNMDPNSYKVFKVNNPNDIVKWSVTKKEYINIVEVQGKKNNYIVIKSGNKEGVCTLRAKVGKKTYLWKIKVKKDKKNSKATLVKVKKTDTKLNVTVRISNQTKERKEYGLGFSVERLENGNWKKLKMQEDYDIESIAKNIPIKESVKETYELGNCYNLEDLKKGIYRISLDVNFDKKSCSKVIFPVK